MKKDVKEGFVIFPWLFNLTSGKWEDGLLEYTSPRINEKSFVMDITWEEFFKVIYLFSVMAGWSILTNHSLELVHEKGWCSPVTVDTLTALGYKQLTTIQLLALPHLLTKANTYIHARTGSGKTLAFLVPALERLKAMQFKDKHGMSVFRLYSIILTNSPSIICIYIEFYWWILITFALDRSWSTDNISYKRAGSTDCCCSQTIGWSFWVFKYYSYWRHED